MSPEALRNAGLVESHGSVVFCCVQPSQEFAGALQKLED